MLVSEKVFDIFNENIWKSNLRNYEKHVIEINQLWVDNMT